MNPKLSARQIGGILILAGLVAGVLNQPQSDPAMAGGRGERFGKGIVMLSMITIGAVMVVADLLKSRIKPRIETTAIAVHEGAPRSSVFRIFLMLIMILAGGAAGLLAGGYGYDLWNPLPTNPPKIGEKFRATPAMRRPQARLTWMIISTLVGGGVGFATVMVGASIGTRKSPSAGE